MMSGPGAECGWRYRTALRTADSSTPGIGGRSCEVIGITGTGSAGGGREFRLRAGVVQIDKRGVGQGFHGFSILHFGGQAHCASKSAGGRSVRRLYAWEADVPQVALTPPLRSKQLQDYITVSIMRK